MDNGRGYRYYPYGITIFFVLAEIFHIFFMRAFYVLLLEGALAVFRVTYKQRDTQRRITIALALICLVVCSVDVQLYLECQVISNTVTCPRGLSCHRDYFNMSINELMNVVVINVQRSSFLLNFPRYYPDKAQQPA
jgi:hypothetical protein